MLTSSKQTSVLCAIYHISKIVRLEKEKKECLLFEIGSTKEPSREQKEKLSKVSRNIAELELQLNMFSK